MKANINTNWTSPTPSLIKGMNALRKCLASGYNARLIKMWNENCSYPIIEKQKNQTNDINNWDSSNETLWTLKDINESKSLSADQKYMMINYVQVFGTPEAKENYEKTGVLTHDNVRGVGRKHFVKREDMINFLIKNHETDRARCFDLENGERHFVPNFHLKPEAVRTPKKFNKKLWVVEMLSKDEPQQKVPFLVHIIKVIVYPLKWIPKKNVLRMKEYKCVIFRWGSVINGFSIEFHLPKKFSFN